MTKGLADMIRGGVLRAAINTGNRALVQQVDGELKGVSPALARLLANELGVSLETVVYKGAGKVFDAVDRDEWDIAFLAIDELRSRKVTFSTPYHRIEATYAVRVESSIVEPGEADREGMSIVAAKGAAYELYLNRNLRNADIVWSNTPPESFEDFKSGVGDAVAGIRASLEKAFSHDPDFRILPGVLTTVDQAMVLPGANNALKPELDEFVLRALETGVVARHVK